MPDATSPREHHLAVRRWARYYTLGGTDTPVRDVWIVCHGYGQLAGTFIQGFAVVDVPGRLIVAPEGLSRFYLDGPRERRASATPARVGATWMTREDREHEIDDHVAYLDQLLDTAVGASAVGVRRRAVGFSQGVATVARWVARSSARIDQLVLWAGAFPPDIDLAAFARRVDGTSVVLVSGIRDELASWAGAEAQLARFGEAGIDARLVTFDGGHRVDDGTLAAIADDAPTDR